MYIIRITKQNQKNNKVDKISLEQSYFATVPKIQDGHRIKRTLLLGTELEVNQWNKLGNIAWG
jgi:hypothetical protein